MARNLVVNGVTYNGVEEVRFATDTGETVVYTDLAEVSAIVESEVTNQLDGAKADIVMELIAQIGGLPVFGTVDGDNKITVTSTLANGIYHIMYENSDGTTTEIGTMNVTGGKVEIINLLPTALTPDDITTVFAGKGYKNGYYASAAEPFYNVDANFFCAGLMPISANSIFYIKGCTVDTALSHTRFGLAAEDGKMLNAATLANWERGVLTFTELGSQYYSVHINPNWGNGVDIPYYFYFSASGTGEGVIVSHTPIE